MRILRTIEELAELRGPVNIAIGVFDGLHRGHREVLRAAIEGGAKDGGCAVVLTFDPHPAVVLRPDQAPAVLTPTRDKLRLLEELSIDAVLLHPFNMDVASSRARAFIGSLVTACAPLAQIAVGWDWTFGRNREGDTTMLRSLGEEFGFAATVIDPVCAGDTIISSTAIRAAIGSGDIQLASMLLGHQHCVTAVVMEGKKLGRQLGFPTANLPMAGAEVLLPPNGVYAVRAHGPNGSFKQGSLNGVANLGVRPTVDSIGVRQLEVHLFDFAGDLYGKELRIEFVDRLRDERKFDSLEALKTQINEDVKGARSALSKGNSLPAAWEAEKSRTFR